MRACPRRDIYQSDDTPLYFAASTSVAMSRQSILILIHSLKPAEADYYDGAAIVAK